MSGKNLRKTKIKAGNPAAVALLLAFGCGVGVCMLLLALAALLLTRTNLPLSAVRPMACMAASIGVAVSGFVLARRLKEKLLLCGLGCGAFLHGLPVGGYTAGGRYAGLAGGATQCCRWR